MDAPVETQFAAREVASAMLRRREARLYDKDRAHPPRWVAYRLRGGWARVEATREPGVVRVLVYSEGVACPCSG